MAPTTVSRKTAAKTTSKPARHDADGAGPASSSSAAGQTSSGRGASRPARAPHAEAELTITSKNYGAWSLRGWLLARFAGLEFTEHVQPPDDPATRAEILLLSSSIRVPSLRHGDVTVWDTLAIGEYLHEAFPEAGLLPKDVRARAHCRAICGEMHSGFTALRSALPMNLRAHFPSFKIWSRARADIDHITDIWRECLHAYGGPFLFGAQRTMADAMYAPVCTRFTTYDVKLDPACEAYRALIMGLPEMKAWIKAAQQEPADIDELDVEF